MKKYALLMIAAFALILAACSGAGSTEPTVIATVTPSTTQTEQTTTPTEAPTTIPSQPAETTVSTEPEETTVPTEHEQTYELTVEDWQTEEPEYLSYEDYFCVERNYAHKSDLEWIKGNKAYKLRSWLEDPVIICYETGERYLVPNGTLLKEYYISGADGRYAYCYNESEFLRFDLTTGQTQTLLTVKDFCGFYLRDNLVLYYATYEDNLFTVNRLYLPTMDQEMLYQQEGEFWKISLARVDSTREPLVWTMMNPEMITVLKKELSDPDSPYKTDGQHDYSKYWEMELEEGVTAFIGNYPLLYEIQEGTGVPAFLKCAYDPVTGSYTEQTGIVDSCWFGSGYPHDHYASETPEVSEPEVIMSDWLDIAAAPDFALCPEALEKDGSEGYQIVLVTEVDSCQYLYAKTDGDYKKIVDAPVKAAIDTTLCAIYVSMDDRVFAVSYDGTQTVELYQAVHGEISDAAIGTECSRLVIQDGTTLVEIDLAQLRYRELVRHEYMKNFYIDSDYQDIMDIGVYFDVYVGMYVAGYTLNFETGELGGGFRL